MNFRKVVIAIALFVGSCAAFGFRAHKSDSGWADGFSSGTCLTGELDQPWYLCDPEFTGPQCTVFISGHIPAYLSANPLCSVPLRQP